MFYHSTRFKKINLNFFWHQSVVYFLHYMYGFEFLDHCVCSFLMRSGRRMRYEALLCCQAHGFSIQTFQFSSPTFLLNFCQLPSMRPNSRQVHSDKLYWNDYPSLPGNCIRTILYSSFSGTKEEQKPTPNVTCCTKYLLLAI